MQRSHASRLAEVRSPMSIEQDIVTLLSPLVSGRVYPDVSPEDIRDPHIVYSVIYGAGWIIWKAIPASRICACNSTVGQPPRRRR